MSKSIVTCCLAVTVAVTALEANETPDDLGSSRRLAMSLKKQAAAKNLHATNLEITIDNGVVTAAGRVESERAIGGIVGAMVVVEGLKEIRLNLGVGQDTPVPRVVPGNTMKHQKIRWEDGSWDLDFGKKPRTR